MDRCSLYSLHIIIHVLKIIKKISHASNQSIISSFRIETDLNEWRTLISWGGGGARVMEHIKSIHYPNRMQSNHRPVCRLQESEVKDFHGHDGDRYVAMIVIEMCILTCLIFFLIIKGFFEHSYTLCCHNYYAALPSWFPKFRNIFQIVCMENFQSLPQRYCYHRKLECS